LKISPVFSDEGELLNFVGIQTDITERKRAEEERDRFFTISIDLLYCWFGWLFQALEPGLGKTLLHTNEELLVEPFLNFVHPEDRAATRQN